MLNNLYELRKFTDTPGKGVTRFSFTEKDAKAREYIIKRAEAAGCNVTVDALQNIRIGLPGNVPGWKTVIAGSHIDSVKCGGWLDGVAGVTGALEVMETLATAVEGGFVEGKPLKYNYEVMIFAEEEGSNFGSTMTGSKFLTGIYGEEELDKLHDDTGRTLRDALEAVNNAPVDLSNILIDFDSIKTMLELHIEQGPVLDREGLQLGVVDCIFGMRVVEVTLTGVGNHAGACPMAERYDALMAASEAMLAAEALVKAVPDKRTVVTMGKMDVLPNQSNVIPETVKFSLEVRDNDQGKIDCYMDRCIEKIREVASARGVECEIKEHSKAAPIKLSSRVVDDMVRRAEAAGMSYKVMNSGAVHDACMLAYHVDTGMIFVPSINGRSHVPEENTEECDIIAGAQFLMDTVLTELTTE